MIITRAGSHFIKLQSGDTVVAVNPISKDSKEKSQRFGADVALISLNHADFNGSSEVSFGNKNPFIIGGPGEYEVSGIFVKGFGTKSSYDGEEKINTIYVLNFESMKICFLGAITVDQSNTESLSQIEEADILFVPLGKDTLSPSEAYKIAVSLDPKIMIPLGDDSMVKLFMKEAGQSDAKKEEKLTLRKKELDGKDGEVFLLSY